MIFYNSIPSLDLIIIQPISDSYKDYHKYSTKSILSNVKKECVVIMFPSMYFTGYYPNIIHDNMQSINMIVHDVNIIKKFISSNNKQTFVNECTNMVKDLNFYSKEHIMNNINNSINNLSKKELEAINKYNPQNFIKISTFILNNYMKQILFHSLNHQSKFTYRHLSNEILRILQINITPYSENLDPQLRGESCIMYECVKNVINKDFEKNRFSERNLPDVDLKTFLEFCHDKYLIVKDYLTKKYS